MDQWFGYMGKILRADLSECKITKEPLRKDMAKSYIGCTGYAVRILWEELKPGIDPLGPENKVVFSTGPLTGTLCPGSGSYEICFKSPLTGIWAEARSGGVFGPKMKFSGFDFIVLEGKSEEPVYLWVCDGEAEIRDAKHLWGKTVSEVTDIILKEIDSPEASVACIGPAGEKLVKAAAVVNDYYRVAARCSPGAVLGSKNLEAVAVQGTKDILVAEPERFTEAVIRAEEVALKNPFREFWKALGTPGLLELNNAAGSLPTKHGYTTYFDSADKISGATLNSKYLVKREACFGCPFGCGRLTEVKHGPYSVPPHGGPEYETMCMLGSFCSHDNLEAIIKANYLCNNYGLDTISVGNVIAFTMECYERGLLTASDIGGKLEWGDSEGILALIEKIARREGIGDMLAEGVRSAAIKIGKGASELAMQIKGLEVPAKDPRGEARTMALQFALAPRGACHMHPNWPSAWDSSKFDDGLKPFGLPPPADKFAETGVGKGLAYKLMSLHGTICEIMGTCIFYVWGFEGSCLTPKNYAEIFSTLTGWHMDQFELMKAAERVWNLKRCFNVREGISREEDRLPKRFFEPVATGPAKGQAVKNLDGMLDEYYESSGWDTGTGVPTRKKLEELGLQDIADQLEKLKHPN